MREPESMSENCLWRRGTCRSVLMRAAQRWQSIGPSKVVDCQRSSRVPRTPEEALHGGQRSLLQPRQLPGHAPQHHLGQLPGGPVRAHANQQRVLVLRQVQLLLRSEGIHLLSREEALGRARADFSMTDLSSGPGGGGLHEP
jgi:hypothetical protein